MKRKKLTSEDELQLLDECIKKHNCEKLIQQYKGLIYHLVRKTLDISSTEYTTEDIEDLCHDVYEVLFKDEYKNLKKYDKNKGRSLARWIAHVSIWTARKSLRKKGILDMPKRGNLLFINGLEEESEVAKELELDIGLNRETDRLEARQSLKLIFQDCMKKLSEQEKLVFKSIFIDGLSPSQISDILNITPENIYTIKSRAVAKLKKCIEEFEKK